MGFGFAHDPAFVAQLAEHRDRLEIYLQFDGFDDDVYRALRGEPLAEIKLRAIENLGRYGIRATLVTTLQTDVNQHEVGRIVRFGLAAAVDHRHQLSAGDVFRTACTARATGAADHIPRRGASAWWSRPTGYSRRAISFRCRAPHPNCHTLSYLYRTTAGAVPLTRFIDAGKHLEILANGITFTRPRARQLIEQYLGSLGCCGGNGCCEPVGIGTTTPAFMAGNGHSKTATEFFDRALREELSPADVFRITITSFLDAYNFDVRRLMKCCIHHVLPSGHVIPFCAYNVLYRDGHVPLPEIRRAVGNGRDRRTVADVALRSDHGLGNRNGHRDCGILKPTWV